MLHAVGLFCEDIREEKSGELTLIGLLPDNINVPPPPAELADKTIAAFMPKLGLYLRINLDVAHDRSPMTLKLVFHDGTEQPIGEVPTEIIEQSQREAIAKNLPIAGIVSRIVMMPFRVHSGGIMQAVLGTKDGDHTCAVLNLLVPETKPG